jgi:predicted SPOUT superfamily RNA methylase MTH1
LTFLGKTLAVTIPDTVLEEHDSARDKTVKLGQIARTCAIFGVDIVEVFRDRGGRDESGRIKMVLEYLETPQYLRKRIFPLDEDLKFAGLLPPLRTPSHKPKISLEDVRVGEIREGLTNADGTVDVGLEKPPTLRERIAENRRVTVKITSKNPLKAEVVSREAVGQYWGYTVESKTLEDVLGDHRPFLKIATSKLGDPVRTTLPRLGNAVAGASGVKFLFGAPSRGLFEIVGRSLRERVDFVVNLFAEQHVETVRTEEAVSAALNLLNFLST